MEDDEALSALARLQSDVPQKGLLLERSRLRIGYKNTLEVVLVGSEAALISSSAREHGIDKTFQVDSTNGAVDLLRELAHPGDVVLIKGSRSARMEKIVEGLAAP